MVYGDDGVMVMIVYGDDGDDGDDGNDSVW